MKRFSPAIIVLCLAGLILLALLLSDHNQARQTIDLMNVISENEGNVTTHAQDPNVLFFGFTVCINPQENVRNYMVFLDYLEKNTGHTLWPHFAVEEKIIDKLAHGIVQFAALEYGTYMLSRKKYGFVPLVSGLNREGKAECRSVIIAGKNSPIKKIENLKGKRFAFGNISSTSGHLIPRIILHEHGLPLTDFANYAYTGSHYNCANAVASGRFDAGCISQTFADKLASEGIIKIIYVSRSYPSFLVVANKEVPDHVLSEVKEVLLHFKSKTKIIESFDCEGMQIANGFTETGQQDFDELEKWAEKFHFMEGI